MTFFRKFLPKILVAGVVVAFLIFAPFSLFGKIHALNYSFNKQFEFDFSGILTLWNVDTFEGGSVSRTTFLEKRAIEFEKMNKGTYVNVQNISKEQLKLNLQAGKKPNIITFGIGVGDIFCEQLKTLDFSCLVRDDLLESAKISGKLKAVPIMLGGYTLVSNKEYLQSDDILQGLKTCKNKDLIFSSTDSINPLLALFVNDLFLSEQKIEQVDSFDAYDKFINNKYCALLGTQRDYFRCKNRESNLKMQCGYNLLGGFSDLIQYASVFFSTQKAEEMSEKFLKYLVSENVQSKLSNINMFPVTNQNIYNDEDYKQFNKILLSKMKTLNAFYSETTLTQIKNLVTEFVICGKKENKTEILKFLNG